MFKKLLDLLNTEVVNKNTSNSNNANNNTNNVYISSSNGNVICGDVNASVINGKHITGNSENVKEQTTSGNNDYKVNNLNHLLLESIKSLNIGESLSLVLNIHPDNKPDLSIMCDSNIASSIGFTIDNGNLNIRSTSNYYTSNPIKIELQLPSIDSINLSGSAQINGKIYSNKEVSIDLSGSSQIKLQGKVLSSSLKGSGASQLQLSNLESSISQIKLSGASSAHIWAEKSIHSKLSGASSLIVDGKPSIVEHSCSGAASAKKGNCEKQSQTFQSMPESNQQKNDNINNIREKYQSDNLNNKIKSQL